MAISLINNPPLLTPVNNNFYLIVSADTTDTKYNFYYRYEFFIYPSLSASAPSSPQVSIKVLPNPYNQENYEPGYGEFNINLLLKDFVEYQTPDYSFTGDTRLAVDNKNLKRYGIRVTENYSETAGGTPSNSGSTSNFEYFFFNGVLYNEQYYDYSINNYRIPITYNYYSDTYKTKFLTNRPLKSTISEINQFDVVNISSLGVSQSHSYSSNTFPQTSIFFRQPAQQPIGWDAPWITTNNNNNMFATYDGSGFGRNTFSPILAVYAGYMNTTSSFYQDNYSIYTGIPGYYFGSYTQLKAGSYLNNMKLRFTYLGTPQNFNNKVKLWGRLKGFGTWTPLSLSDNPSVTLLTGTTTIVKWNNRIEVANDFDEIGISFENIFDNSIISIGKNCFNFTNETEIPEPILFETTLRSFYLVGYNSLNQIIRVEQEPLPQKNPLLTFNMQEPRSFMFKKDYFDSYGISYAKVFVGPLTNNLDDIINNNYIATEVYTITNNCNKLSSYENKTIVWHNRLGAWDSYDFIAVNQTENKVNKVIYSQPRTRSFNRNSLQSKSFNVDFNQEISISTKPIINKSEINWIKEILDADVVYEYNKVNNELIPITILTNSIVEKPVNNIASQIKLEYTYSQKEIVR